MKQLSQVNIGQEFLNLQGGHDLPSGSTTFENLSGISSLVSLFLKISFVIAGLILLFYFILGGIGMISSAGKSDPKTAEQAKATITSAVIGFVVVFTAYWIVKLIATLFGVPNII
jgi:hypothetical protein